MSDDRDVIWKLLSEGLDLCVRARNLDAMDRRAATLAVSSDPEAWKKDGAFDRYVERHNITFTDQPIHTRSATIPLWLQDQYERDLADWERRSRAHLQANPSFDLTPSTPASSKDSP